MGLTAAPQPGIGSRIGTNGNAISNIAYAFLTIFWLGALLGVSFLATPVKFLVPSLDLSTALDVGRVTFAILIKGEWVLWVLLALSMTISLRFGLRLIGCAVLAAFLAVQTFWLLPVLDERVAQIMAGIAVSPSNFHIFYVAAEIAKVFVLFGLSLEALLALARRKDAG